MNYKAVLLSTVLLLSVIVISSCEKPANESVKETKSKTVFVLFDVSDSTKDEATRKKYLESFGIIADSLKDGDAIVADFINDDPLGKATFALNTEFPVFDPKTDNELLIKAKRGNFEEEIKALRSTAKEKADEILSSEDAEVTKTRLIDSCQLAEKVFNKMRRSNNVLVIFSDMLESSEKADFEKQKVTSEITRKIIETEKTSNRLPQFKFTTVYVVGAAGTDRAASFNQVQDFWIEYFKTAGASLSKENYGAALLKFDE